MVKEKLEREGKKCGCSVKTSVCFHDNHQIDRDRSKKKKAGNMEEANRRG